MGVWAIIVAIVEAIIEAAKVVVEVKKVIDVLNGLSQGGLQGLVRSLVVGELVGTVSRELGIGSDAPPDAQEVTDEVTSAAESVVSETTERLADVGFSIDADALVEAIAVYAAALLRGRAIAGAPSGIQNATGAGDPVRLVSGEFERSVVDLEIAGAGIDLELRRTYRSRTVYLGPLGPGWDHSLNLWLREEGPHIVMRLTGHLSEQRFVRHPRFGEADYTFYAPPDGFHAILVPDGAGSFELRHPDGRVEQYEASDVPGEHRIRRIASRFGSALGFVYDVDSRLIRVTVNSVARFVDFGYDDLGRISHVTDHVGRRIDYAYDDRGQLARVSGPDLGPDQLARTETYRYAPIERRLQLVEVEDWAGRIVVENEYQTSTVAEFAGWLIRQAVNRGETLFEYERLQWVPDDPAAVRDMPTLRILETRRDGHVVEHLLNAFGNELHTREDYVEAGRTRTALTSYRYNADGEIVGLVDPEGCVTQFVFGRDLIAADTTWPDISPALGGVTGALRGSFGNLLVMVSRSQRVGPLTDRFAGDFWANFVPAPRAQADADDIIHKYTYDDASHLLVGASDPRFTTSPDPLHVESAPPGTPTHDATNPLFIAHEAHLTRTVYGPAPRYEVRERLLPDRTRPSALDGVAALTGLREVFAGHAPNGDPLDRINATGHEFHDELHQSSAVPAEAPKEGYLRYRWLPHQELLAGAGMRPSLEVAFLGTFDLQPLFSRSSGALGDAITLDIEGDRIRLFQSADPLASPATHPGVQVTLDGAPLTAWDQSASSDYLVENAGYGRHVVVLRDPTGDRFAFGRAVSQVRFEFTVDALGRVVREIDGGGVETLRTFDALGRETRVARGSPPDQTVTTRIHDPDGHVLEERREWRDAAGALLPGIAAVRRRSFDSAGNMVLEEEGPAAGGPMRRVRHEFDAEDRLRTTRSSRGMRTLYEYDPLGRETRYIRAACLPICQVTRTSYDRAGNMLLQRNGRGAIRRNAAVVGGTVHQGIDAFGRTVWETDPLGHLTSRRYNALGKVEVERRFERGAGGTFALLSLRTTAYDEHGDATVVGDAFFGGPIATADPIGNPDAEFDAAVAAGDVAFGRTELMLDAYGQIVATRNADGTIDRESFDGQGRSVATVAADGTATVRVLTGAGKPRRVYRHEPAVDPVTGAPAADEVFVEDFEHDELGREVARLDPYGNRWTTAYDSLGSVTGTTDPLGNETHHEYNVFGEPTLTRRNRTDSGLGAGAAIAALTEARSYDNSGNLTLLTDALGRRIAFEHDLLDRRTTQRWLDAPGLPVEHKSYDRADNLSRMIHRSGIVKRLTYDLSDRHVRTDVDQTAAAASDRLWAESPTFRAFAYDGAANVTSHENDVCRVEIARDSAGHPVRERITLTGVPGAPPAQIFERRFDARGRITMLIYPSGREVSILRDPVGRPRTIRNISAGAGYPGRAANASGVDLARFAYSGRSLARAVLGNGTVLSVTRDGRGHVLERRLRRGAGQPLWRQQVLRDGAGKLRLERAQAGGPPRRRMHFFDSVGQLVAYEESAGGPWLDPGTVGPPEAPLEPAVAIGQATIDAAIGPMDATLATPSFTYDDAGNRTLTAELGGPTFPTVPNALDEYASVDGTAWSYDLDGHIRSDGTLTFAYDLNGALASVSDAGGERMAVLRDALARPVVEREPAGTRFVVFDSERPLQEIRGGQRAEFVSDHDERRVLHVARGGEDFWLSYDGIGSLRAVVDGSGAPVERPTYRPYGELQSGTLPTAVLPVGFAGMRTVEGSPLYQSGARTYRTDVGRHHQPDPAGLAEGPQVYHYAHNDPVGGSDPAGSLVLVDDVLFWALGSLFGTRSDSFLAGVGQNFVESWSVVLGTFNTFKGAQSAGDVMWGVFKLAHKLTLGLPQEIAGLVAAYGAVELFGAETEMWENVQLIKVPNQSFGAFTLGSRVVGDATVLAPGPTGFRAHEQGHFYQNLVLGPLYLPVIAIPSIIHAGIHVSSGKSQSTYGSFYTEGWADSWGAIGHVPSGKQVASAIGIGLGIAAAANILGLIGYEAERRRDPERERRLDPLQRLSPTGDPAFQRPFYGPGLP